VPSGSSQSGCYIANSDFTMLRRPVAQVCLAAGIASIFASVMILHVFTWFMVDGHGSHVHFIMLRKYLCANLGQFPDALRSADWSLSAPLTAGITLGDELDYLIGEYRT